jgi:lipid-binding SYLF domain-containing protein
VRRSKIGLMGEQGGSMEKLITKLNLVDVKTLFEFMRLSKGAEVSTHPQPVKLDLLLVDLKLDGPATYLSWSCRIKGFLAGRNLEGFLTGEEEPRQDTARWNE